MTTYISTRTREKAELIELTDDIAYLKMLGYDPRDQRRDAQALVETD